MRLMGRPLLSIRKPELNKDQVFRRKSGSRLRYYKDKPGFSSLQIYSEPHQQYMDTNQLHCVPSVDETPPRTVTVRNPALQENLYRRGLDTSTIQESAWRVDGPTENACREVELPIPELLPRVMSVTAQGIVTINGVE